MGLGLGLGLGLAVMRPPIGLVVGPITREATNRAHLLKG